jgi:hypothetical protein
LFAFAAPLVVLAGAVFAFVPFAGITTVVPEFAVTVVFAVTAAFAGGAVFASAVFEFRFVIGGCVDSISPSGLPLRTETPPCRAGIEMNKAESIKTVAATIVIFERTVAVPRGPNAELEILLVKSAPASVFPGCSNTDTISMMQDMKNIV